MAAVDLDIIDEAKVIDIDRNFGVKNFLERRNNRFVEVAIGLTRSGGSGFLRQETLKIILLAFEGLRSALNTRFGRRFDAAHFFEPDVALAHPKILCTLERPRINAATSLLSL